MLHQFVCIVIECVAKNLIRRISEVVDLQSIER